jgi:hypothetical protein
MEKTGATTVTMAPTRYKNAAKISSFLLPIMSATLNATMEPIKAPYSEPLVIIPTSTEDKSYHEIPLRVGD